MAKGSGGGGDTTRNVVFRVSCVTVDPTSTFGKLAKAAEETQKKISGYTVNGAAVDKQTYEKIFSNRARLLGQIGKLEEQQAAKSEAMQKRKQAADEKAARTQEKIIRDRIREEDKAVRAAESAHKKQERSHKAVEHAAFQVTESVMGLARAYAMSGAIGEKDMQKVVDTLLKIEVGFGALRSGLGLIQSMTRAWELYRKAAAAAAAATVAANIAGGVGGAAGAAGGRAAGGLAGGAVGGAGVAGAARLGGGALSALPYGIIAAGAAGFGLAGYNAVQSARGVSANQRINFRLFEGGGQDPYNPEGVGFLRTGLANVWGQSGHDVNNSAERLRKIQERVAAAQRQDVFQARWSGTETDRVMGRMGYQQQLNQIGADSGAAPAIAALRRQSAMLPMEGFDYERSQIENKIAMHGAVGNAGAVANNLADVKGSIASTQMEMGMTGAGSEQRSQLESRITQLKQQQLDLTRQQGEAQLRVHDLAIDGAQKEVDQKTKTLNLIQQQAQAGRQSIADSNVAFGMMDPSSRAKALSGARAVLAGNSTWQTRQYSQMIRDPTLNALSEDQARQEGLGNKDLQAVLGPSLERARSDERAAMRVQGEIDIKTHEIEFVLKPDREATEKTFRDAMKPLLDDLLDAVDKAVEKSRVDMQKQLNGQAVFRRGQQGALA